jgi:glycosylphosphatidylinositol transamidase (GPIT) subunit GPI8
MAMGSLSRMDEGPICMSLTGHGGANIQVEEMPMSHDAALAFSQMNQLKRCNDRYNISHFRYMSSIRNGK